MEMALDDGNSAAADLEAKFQRLVAAWKKETAHLPSLEARQKHRAYQQIIAMDRPALPLIFRELEARPDYWFFALRQITGERPVPRELRGKLPEMTAIWLKWAKDNGITW
jgi:hypothetical protein